MPSFYFEAITELEARVLKALDAERDSSKKMGASEAKTLNSIRHNVKKNALRYTNTIRESNQGLEGDEDSTLQPASIRVVTGLAVVLEESDLFTALRLVVSARGKKNTNPEEQIHKLEDLLLRASSPYKKLRVLLSLAQALFDTANGTSSYLSIPLWRRYVPLKGSPLNGERTPILILANDLELKST